MVPLSKFIIGALFCSSLCCGLLMPTPAHAQNITKLTDENVREFIETTAAIMNGQHSDMTDEEIDAYLELHIESGARFKSTMRYTIPGYEVQEKIMSVNKDEFMRGINEASNSVDGYENQIQIDDISITDDGKKAIVKTRSHESGKMPVTDNIEQAEVPIEGVSSCSQIITLNKKNVIQMYGATCVTDIEFIAIE